MNLIVAGSLFPEIESSASRNGDDYVLDSSGVHTGFTVETFLEFRVKYRWAGYRGFAYTFRRMHSPATVLVVDDHQLIREGVRSILGGRPNLFTVCGEASNGQEGVEKATALKPDVVILDISMPIMDGLEAARRIRGLLPATKIVVLSMHSSKQMSDKALQVGADAFVQKGSVASDLVSTLTGLVQ